jgi:hypothetical protein
MLISGFNANVNPYTRSGFGNGQEIRQSRNAVNSLTTEDQKYAREVTRDSKTADSNGQQADDIRGTKK